MKKQNIKFLIIVAVAIGGYAILKKTVPEWAKKRDRLFYLKTVMNQALEAGDNQKYEAARRELQALQAA